MNSKRFILMVMLAILMSSSVASAIVMAKHGCLIDFHAFNLTEDKKKSYYFDKAYNPVWEVSIYVSLVFNGTEPLARAAMSFIANESGSKEEFRFHIYGNKNFNIQYLTFTGEALTVVSGVWNDSTTEGLPEFRIVMEQTYTTIYGLNATSGKVDCVLCSKFPASYPIGRVIAWGPDTGWTKGTFCDAGYVTVEIDTNIASGLITTILDVVVPLVVLSVTLGVIVKILDKLGKVGQH